MTQKNNEPKTLIIVSIITGIFGIVTALISGFFLLKASKAEQQALTTNTALAQQVTSGNATQDSLIQTVDAPIIAPVYTQTALPTYTPFPTIPQTATQISSSPTPTIQLPFSDNFDNGINPFWKTVTGTWRMVNGQLTADPSNNYVTILVGDNQWTDYVIDVDVHKTDTNAGFPVGIIVRANNGNYLIYQWSCCDTDWILVNGTSRTIIAHLDQGIITSSGAGNTSKNHLHVEVHGQTFTGSVDEKLYLTVSDPTISSGMVGLTFNYPFQNTFRFENFIVMTP